MRRRLFFYFFIGGVKSIQNADLVKTWLDHKNRDAKDFVFKKICLLLNITKPSRQVRDHLWSTSRLFCLNLSRRWAASFRNRHRFEYRNRAWLQTNISLPTCLLDTQAKADIDQAGPSHTHGRPLKPFDECSRIITAGRTPSEVKYAAN